MIRLLKYWQCPYEMIDVFSISISSGPMAVQYTSRYKQQSLLMMCNLDATGPELPEVLQMINASKHRETVCI